MAGCSRNDFLLHNLVSSYNITSRVTKKKKKKKKENLNYLERL